jgi:hypothetical protein
VDDQRATSSRVFIVARRHPELYDYLKSRFADDTTVMVVLDRRLAPRRRRALPAAAERRRADRRSRPEVDQRLTSTSLAIVGGSVAPVSEARQWVEAMQRGVQAVRGALDDHDRLEHAALAVRLENDRLRAEIDRSSKELSEIDATITRAIELVTDLRSRLHKEPWREPTG